MHSRLHLPICFSACFAFALLATAPAAGAESTWETIGVTLYGLGSGTEPVLTVKGSLDPAVDLPTVAELPIPHGSHIVWVGEVHGQNPMGDTVAPFATQVGTGCDVLSVSMERARAVQAEMRPPVGWVVAGPDGTVVAMEWTALESVDHVQLAFQVAPDLHAEHLRPPTAQATVSEDGTRYTIEADSVAAGEVLTLVGTVVSGADPIAMAAGQPAASRQPTLGGTPHHTTPLVLAIVALGAAALAVVLVFAFRQRGVDRDRHSTQAGDR